MATRSLNKVLLIKIAFRAWDMARNQMVDWENLKTRGMGIFVNNYLMQFTGLLDKNGKEIYEGDIVSSGVKNSPRICEIYWNDEQANFSVRYKPHNFDEPLFDFTKWTARQGQIEVEIIGNIYENPELLQKESRGDTK